MTGSGRSENSTAGSVPRAAPEHRESRHSEQGGNSHTKTSTNREIPIVALSESRQLVLRTHRQQVHRKKHSEQLNKKSLLTLLLLSHFCIVFA